MLPIEMLRKAKEEISDLYWAKALSDGMLWHFLAKASYHEEGIDFNLDEDINYAHWKLTREVITILHARSITQRQELAELRAYRARAEEEAICKHCGTNLTPICPNCS